MTRSAKSSAFLSGVVLAFLALTIVAAAGSIFDRAMAGRGRPQGDAMCISGPAQGSGQLTMYADGHARLDQADGSWVELFGDYTCIKVHLAAGQ